jgi:hypothetical protein
MHRHPNIDSLFLTCSNEDGKSYPFIDGDVFNVKGEETFNNIIKKTICSFEFFKDSNYDFFVRTNLSSMWNYDKLYSFCKRLPRTGTYCGIVGNHYGQLFVSGSGMIMSADIVRKIITLQSDIYNVGIIDDVDIGTVMLKNGVNPIPGRRMDITTKEIYDKIANADHSNIDHFHFRLKNSNRDEEIEVAELLFSDIYST